MTQREQAERALSKILRLHGQADPTLRHTDLCHALPGHHACAVAVLVGFGREMLGENARLRAERGALRKELDGVPTAAPAEAA